MTDSSVPLSFLLAGRYKDKYPYKLVAHYPHVAKRIEELWNNGEGLADYFTNLLIADRVDRQGFPAEIAAEIMALSLAYDKIGQIKPEMADSSSDSGIRDYRWESERAATELEKLGIQKTTANFSRAVDAGDQSLCMLFISAGFHVDERDARHWTPLMIASFNGKESLALELIKHGASVDAQDIGGYTPLHWAAYNGYRKVVILLLSKGASINAASNAGITPLLQAAARGHVEVVTTLVEKRGDPNIVANDGSSPLLKAIANGHYDVVRLLISAGASTDVTMKNGTTLLEVARRSRDSRIRSLLLDNSNPSA